MGPLNDIISKWNAKLESLAKTSDSDKHNPPNNQWVTETRTSASTNQAIFVETILVYSSFVPQADGILPHYFLGTALFSGRWEAPQVPNPLRKCAEGRGRILSSSPIK